ncbi:hypothetical protein PFTANZ_06666, partial [Plasmodium falciparum Tanzania (2000708)]
MPESLDDEPKDVKGKCNCKDEEAPPPQPARPDVCNTVATALEDNKYIQDACNQKYGKNAPSNWKCVTPSGAVTTTPPSNSGATCIPPRRRRLYVGKLEEWAKNYNTGATGTTQVDGSNKVEGSDSDSANKQAPSEAQTQPQGDTTSQSDNKLRDAFIQSAAIETFFLWDRYKKEKKPPATQNGTDLLALPPEGSQEEDPQKKLEEGEIPDGFLRQMFYTLADYKDILDGKNIVLDLLKDGSPSDKEMYTRENKINEAIDNHFSKSENQATSAAPQPQQQQQPSDNPRVKWWKNHGEHIWKGMICALTYEDSGEKGTSNAPQKIQQ